MSPGEGREGAGAGAGPARPGLALSCRRSRTAPSPPGSRRGCWGSRRPSGPRALLEVAALSHSPTAAHSQALAPRCAASRVTRLAHASHALGTPAAGAVQSPQFCLAVFWGPQPDGYQAVFTQQTHDFVGRELFKKFSQFKSFPPRKPRYLADDEWDVSRGSSQQVPCG